MDLYPSQERAVSQMRNGSILWGGVGSGKSRAAVAYYLRSESPRDIYVITTARKRDSLDWEGEFVRHAIGKDKDTTLHGVLTVDSWNNLHKYREVKNAFFIFDEQRLVGSGEWTKNFLHIVKANHWILLTATPGDTWLDYVPVFVAHGFYRNRSAFKLEHVVYNTYTTFPKVDRYVGVGKLVRLRNSILVEMPFPRHTVRKAQTISVDYDKEAFDRVLRKRWHVYEDRPLRDVAELFLVMRRVVNSDPTRLEAIRNLMQRHPKLIVFYNFDFELESLRSLANFTTTTQEENTHPYDSSHLVEGDGSCPKIVNERTQRHAGTTSSTSGSTETCNSSLSASAVTRTSLCPANGSERTTSPTQTTREFGSTFRIAEWNGHKHQPVPETESWLYLVQYMAGSEAWNCIETDAMAFYSLTYSYKMWHQAHGRIDRLNTPFVDLHYYTLLSDSVIDRAIMDSLAKKRSFNERNIRDKIGQS